MYTTRPRGPFGIAALFLSGTATVWAGTDPAYPAYDFEPQVIYRSPELSAASPAESGRTSEDSAYPAANFQPQVIYRDEAAISRHQTAPTAPEPAAPVESAAPVAAPAVASKAAPVQNEPVAEPASTAAAPTSPNGDSGGSSDRFMVLAAAAALLGFAFTRKGARQEPRPSPPAPEPTREPVAAGEEAASEAVPEPASAEEEETPT